MSPSVPYHGQGATAADPNLGLSQCWSCAQETTVTPHASFLALDVAPQAAYGNLRRLQSLFPGLYGTRGLFDAVNPTTGSVGHPVSAAARTYLGVEQMDLR